MIVVTTGSRFCDIDGLACVIAYKEIPKLTPKAVIVGPLNNSVTTTIRGWKPQFQTKLEPGDYDFVIVDVSELEEFPGFVNKDRVVEIYDHHFGKEKYWQEKLGEKAKIEPVGACATLIWEEFRSRNPLKVISPLSANLLYTAIISNTLHFHAAITTTRDQKAAQEIKPFTTLPENWVAKYYQDQEVEFYRDPLLTIGNDTKIQVIKGIKIAIGQAELWNSADFIKTHQNEIESALRSFATEHWFLTAPSISEGRNYILTRSETVKNMLRSIMTIDFFGTDIGVTDRLWLRKEILKKI